MSIVKVKKADSADNVSVIKYAVMQMQIRGVQFWSFPAVSARLVAIGSKPQIRRVNFWSTPADSGRLVALVIKSQIRRVRF